jgi:uncharacterized membrane protein
MASKVRALIVLIFIVVVPLPAYAYLDPQTGSMIVSAIVAFVATVGMGIQAYWHKLVSLIRSSPPSGDRGGRADDESEQG